MFRIYLAGGKYSEWREDVKRMLGATSSELWDKMEFIDPFSDSRQRSLYEFTNDDLEHIRHSHLVFAFCNYPQFDGMALEFGFAHALDIPIVYVTNLPRIPSMMAGVSKAVFTDLTEACSYVQKNFIVPEVLNVG